MGLNKISVNTVKAILDNLNTSKNTSKKIMSLGYPDIIVNPSHILEIWGKDIYDQLTFHPDSASIIKWHGVVGMTDKIIEAEHFFKLLGFDLEVCDIAQIRGNEVIIDLNEPCQESLHQKYDLIIDTGTCEHCFNIAQAIKNLANMVKVNGYIHHVNPINMFNHGFYNLNPTWYYDFYLTNGFVVHDMKIIYNGSVNPMGQDVSPYGRFHSIPENSSLFSIIQRKELKNIEWPMQYKYKKNPMLGG